ncbi:MAG: hypothetical protein HQL22_01515 [Candidatus Omnitrophica bacterium]|nr:hypothetical protein [Candidatus Omnitrophota bacterium]
MKWQIIWLSLIVLTGCVLGWSQLSYAQSGSNVSFVLMPIQTAFVKGDAAKFRAINWTKDGAQSGIKELKIDSKPCKDVQVSFEGSGIVGDEDYSGSLLITKDNVGYIKLSYDTLRKYYDNRGSYFPAFTAPGMDLQTLDKDLRLDIGHLKFEIGKGSPDDPEFSFSYERGTKNGSKSNTTLAYGYDRIFNTTASTDKKRLISPVFSDKDETSDTLTLKGKAAVSGVTIKGEQQVVFFDAKTMRQEQLTSGASGYTPSPADTKVTQYTEMPQAQEYSTLLRGERWSVNDTTFLSLGYRFGHIQNSMIETERDFASVNNLTTTGLLLKSNGYTVDGSLKGGEAHNVLDSHTFTGQILSNVAKDLVFITKLKAEAENIHGNSNFDTLFSNTSLAAQSRVTETNEDRNYSLAENFSVRYNGLSKIALYTDLDVTQERKTKSLLFPVTGGSRFAQTMNHVNGTEGTIGARITPINKVSLTTEWKYGEKTDSRDLEDGTNASYYFNKIRYVSDSVSSRLAWKPVKWFENSVKVINSMQVNHMSNYGTPSSSSDTAYGKVKMPITERDFIYDVALNPTDQLMFDASYGIKFLKTGGVGSAVTVGGTNYGSYAPPAATANVYTWSLMTSYAPAEKLSIFNSFAYSRAKNQTEADVDNYRNVTSGGGAMSFGIDSEWYDIDTGIEFKPNKDLTIKPHYVYSSYVNFEGLETGNYSAHIIGLDVSLKW